MDETSPLLAESHPQEEEEKKPGYAFELVNLARNTFPIAISFGLQNIVQAFSVLTVGHLGTLELGAASYGYMFATCTGSMLAIGGTTALDTLCSQAYSESKASGNSHVLGIYLQRGTMILVIMYLCLIAPVWWVSADLFVALGQEKEFAVMTATFLRILIPGGLFQIVAECVKKFLQVQGESDAVGWNIGAAAIIGCIANYVFVHVFHLGLWGAPLAHTLYHLCTVIFLFIYAFRSENAKQGWGGFSKESFNRWGEFTGLALSGILTCAAEAWSFETVAMMAATLDTTAIGAQGIIMSSDLIFMTGPLGIGVAASHRIGGLIGSGDAKHARFVARIPYILSFLIGSVELVIIMCVKNFYGYIFSDSEAVVNLTAHVLPVIAFFQISDLVNGGAAGILRGVAKTHLAGISNLVAYYGVGLTSAYYLCFSREMGLLGLWIGVITGSLALAAIQTLWVVLVNWDKEVERAANRLKGTIVVSRHRHSSVSYSTPLDSSG